MAWKSPILIVFITQKIIVQDDTFQWELSCSWLPAGSPFSADAEEQPPVPCSKGSTLTTRGSATFCVTETMQVMANFYINYIILIAELNNMKTFTDSLDLPKYPAWYLSLSSILKVMR